MKEKNRTTINDEEPAGLIIYKSEEEIFQRLPLCKYLSELPEITEEETKESRLKKKEQSLPLKSLLSKNGETDCDFS